jgi:hypothetical protein
MIGSTRRECLDHVIAVNQTHLRRVLTSYIRYYPWSRTHLALEKDRPDHRPATETVIGPVVVILDAVSVMQDEPMGRLRGEHHAELLDDSLGGGMLGDIPVDDPTVPTSRTTKT